MLPPLSSSLIRSCAALAVLACALPAVAQTSALQVQATDRDGKPLPDAVIYVMAPNQLARPPAKPLQMIQRNFVFEPYVLPVMVGTEVVFPNRDRVAHHLRTMNAATEFEFPIYEPGATPKAVRFDKPGATALFCHFHLSMRGYVYTVDSSFFGVTDNAGAVRLAGLPSGEFELRAWHPDMVLGPLVQKIKLGGEAQTVAWKLDVRPRPRPEPRRAPREPYKYND